MLARQYDEKLFIETLFCKDQSRTGRSTVFKAQYVSGYKLFSISKKKKKKGNFPPTYPFCRTNPHTDQLSKGLA